MPSVVLISSGQPSLNPRLVKEADALAQAGYNVTVFYAYWNEWGTEYDRQLSPSRKWKSVRVGGSPENGRITFMLSKIVQKLGRTFKSSAWGFMGLSRASFHLAKEVKKHKADLYIAHNLGALPAACIAAAKHNKPCGFDAEDFHRNETSDDAANADVLLKSAIEDKYIPRLSYLTASSPLIAAQYKTLYPLLNPVVVLNVFDKVDIEPAKHQKPLKLFWFSQTIGRGRGIEDVVSALSTLNAKNFELHLLGHIPVYSQQFVEEIIATGISVKFYAPIPPDEVISFAAQFDLGLALEQRKPLNRDLCLTNKIFTYLQAGLGVIATETTAQATFMNLNKAIGSTFKNNDSAELAGLLSDYQQNRDKLNTCKLASLKLADTTYNWKIESKKFLKVVEETI
ncbi:glycosyltransferase family protein [Mucilaginibacter auburnensis]|uniref:Glycosyltransferase involved in cell wall biosynthesis n=1 Tax=Mucilaginibacter auburnensis TaxID=1457233 RepID=A0A2H9VM94_9SPHI|nr:hypothetical protein [Mucilaginibacter auburnensis]PJJ79460.1 glycosyltransferase involved in cell wall biosynthesis [Mucilaginibacter auburnensis]